VSGKIDKLKELKENVIIGRLIPAGKQYRRMNGVQTSEDIQDEYFDKDTDFNEPMFTIDEIDDRIPDFDEEEIAETEK